MGLGIWDSVRFIKEKLACVLKQNKKGIAKGKGPSLTCG